MSVVMNSNPRRHSMQAFGMAVLIEAAIVVGAVAVLVGTQVKPTISEPVPITLADLPPEQKPEPKPEPPPPQPQPKLKPVLKQVMPRPQTPQPPQEAQPITPAPTPTAVPTAFTQPAPPPPAPPPPPPNPSAKADANATYAAKVNAAIYAVNTYPPSAAMMRFVGRTQVEFHLHDGVLVGEPRVLISCGIGLFDKWALQAVQAAHYPAPPELLRGDDTKITAWVKIEPH